MSPEQFSTPEIHSSAPVEATTFEDAARLDFHASDLTPIEVIRARQAVAAAVIAAPSGSLEVHKIELAPHQVIAKTTLRLTTIRQYVDSDIDDIFAIAEKNTVQPLRQPSAPTVQDSRSAFDLAA